MRRSFPMLSIAAVLGMTTLFAAGCNRDAAPAATTATAAAPAAKPAEAAITDEFSYAQPEKVRINDLALELAVDFAAKQLAGSATYALEWKDQAATELVLDTRDLTIEKVEGEGAGGAWTPLQYTLAPADKVLGSKLTIQAPQRPAKVRVTYKTSPNASGLQWLEPSMTAGKQQPFMFSQSQQIHARSWVPLQDTPQVRFTYSARVTAPADAMVLMSADNDPNAARDGDYRFRMPQKIPSYLLAIAAGDLVFEPISNRAGVWAEPGMAEKAAKEFADTEKMIVAAEKLYGPYRWDRYDILVLPPSFPYGGMENPRLTFATPTVVVGDQSLVSLIAHELAHSWSGNLVTFATPKDGWLNEGFTSYVENRLIEALYGAERAAMETVISRNELKDEFAQVDPKLQVLSLKPGAVADPDGASSATVYTKGAWFLQFLEQRFGRSEFDAFLRGYFDQYAFQSIPTTEFLKYAKANLLGKYPGKVTEQELERWVYEPGIPADAPQVQSRSLSVVDAARVAWLGSGQLPNPAVTSEWSTQEWVHFIDGMPETLTQAQLEQIDKAYGFTGTPNGEIAQRWYPLTVRSGYAQARPAIADFLQRIGRRKLIMPTYEALAKTTDGLAFAREVFAKARPGYHPITTGSVESTLAEAKPAAASAPATEAPAAEQPTAPAQAGGRHGDPTAETPATAPAEPEKPAETR
jgi:leukotriene-A4 hydrolase